MPSEENPDNAPVYNPCPEKQSVRILLDISLGLLVVFLVARIMVSGLNQQGRMPSVNKLIELFAALALVFWILAALAARRLRFERTAVRVPVLIFMALSVLSVAQASYAFPAAHAAATWVIHICVFFLVINLGSDPGRRNVILATVVASAVVVSVLAFYQYFYEFEAVRQFYENNMSQVMVEGNLRADFADRLYLNEAFSTFLLSNTFACYLIMVLPLIVILTVGLLRKRVINSPGVALLITGSVAVTGALYLSGSKGGWLGFLGGAVLFALFYWLYRLTPDNRRRGKLIVLCVFAAFVVLVVAGMLVVGYEKLPLSVRVRLGYWQTTMRMVFHHPLGVGIANFQENYTVYQPHWATEVRSAHNSYLSIWTELSIVGLAAFLAVLYFSGRRYWTALQRHKGSESEDEPEAAGMAGSRKLYLAMLLAGAAGFVLVAILGRFTEICFFTQQFGTITFAAALWIVFAAGLLWSPRVLNMSFAAPGIAVGLLAFACHAFIDFDFYSHGINATFWVLLGLLLCHCCRLEGLDSTEKASSRHSGLTIATAILIIAAVLVFGIYYIPHALSADWQVRSASVIEEDAFRAGYEPELAFGAAQEYEKAQKLSHWNADNYRHAAELYEHVFFKTRDPRYAQMSIENYSRVITLRPNSHNAYAHRGHVRFYSGGGGENAVTETIADAQKAIELYPVSASHHYRLGVYLAQLAELSGPGDVKKLKVQARVQFEEALELHRIVAFPRGKLLPSQLQDIMRRIRGQ